MQHTSTPGFGEPRDNFRHGNIIFSSLDLRHDLQICRYFRLVSKEARQTFPFLPWLHGTVDQRIEAFPHREHILKSITSRKRWSSFYFDRAKMLAKRVI